MAHSGLFHPKNPIKYEGDHTNIVFRSGWEFKMMKWLDLNPDVLEWQSEEFNIPYFYEIDRKTHRYYPDFKAKIRDREGNIKTFIIEVKPHKETLKPKDPGRRSTRYINECRTYIKNQAKWQAADIYARERGMEFIVMTEFHLGIAKKPKNDNRNI